MEDDGEEFHLAFGGEGFEEVQDAVEDGLEVADVFELVAEDVFEVGFGLVEVDNLRFLFIEAHLMYKIEQLRNNARVLFSLVAVTEAVDSIQYQRVCVLNKLIELGTVLVGGVHVGPQHFNKVVFELGVGDDVSAFGGFLNMSGLELLVEVDEVVFEGEGLADGELFRVGEDGVDDLVHNRVLQLNFILQQHFKHLHVLLKVP